nr:His-Xaa-Ser system-associated MauG-like protein [Mesorhizobium sp. J18]
MDPFNGGGSRNAALAAGLVRPQETHVEVSPDLVSIGKLLFQTKKMSLDHETACATCHRDRFGSTDGLPVAIGTEGHGEGISRLLDGGDIIPRNALPFWGRGGVGFDVFFWDGRVDGSGNGLISQFGDAAPSDDPLVVAVHLPPVQIGEMILDIAGNYELESESIGSAQRVYDTIARRIAEDPALGPSLGSAAGVEQADIGFIHIAQAIASFIRFNFRIKDTRFHRFVFDDGELTDDERAGGLLFYGKAGCSACHYGPYFSDLRFHAIPFTQAGFGFNGFGIDYGRFNVTMDPDDRQKFRTPPLYNAAKTGPYSHSGSIGNLKEAIRAHVDPLAVYKADLLTGPQRVQFYESLRTWAREPVSGTYLSDHELDGLVAFLRALEYESDQPVQETE